MASIAIVSGSLQSGQALRTALASQSDWLVLAPVAHIEALDPHVDAVIAVASGNAEASALHRALAGRIPLVLLGDAFVQTNPAYAAPLGALPLDASPRQLRAAVQAVLAGLNTWSPEVSTLDARGAGGELPGEPLTPRELEVLELLAKGLSNRDIAGVLGISAHTAKFHVGQILAKTGAATRAEAVKLGIQRGLIGV